MGDLCERVPPAPDYLRRLEVMADKTIDELCAALTAKREKAVLGGGQKAIENLVSNL